MRRALALFFVLAACFSSSLRAEDSTSLEKPVEKPIPQEMSPQAMDYLVRSQEALFSEDYAACEELVAKASALDPSHPLPRIFLQSMLIYQYQVFNKMGKDTKAVEARLKTCGDDAVQSAEAYIKEHPGGVAKLYLGGAHGARGMGNLYEGSYVVAYRDGKKAYALLKECVAEEPQLYNAYVGLGTFEYESGRLAGVLQYILDLHGDVEDGIKLMKLCEERASYAAPTALMNLARIYTHEVPDAALARHYLSKLNDRFPRNANFTRWCLDEAGHEGWSSPEAAALFKRVARQWDQGWRPDPAAKLDFEKARLEFALALDKAGDRKGALDQARALENAENPALASKAKALMEQWR